MEHIPPTTDTHSARHIAVPSPLAGLTVRMVPSLVKIPLQIGEPAGGVRHRGGPGARLLQSMYHSVEPGRGALVSVTWDSSAGLPEARRARLVRLTVRGESPDWNPRWVRWMYVSRKSQELRGGTAAMAQDRLSDDGAVLSLLMLPEDERREVTLELDGAGLGGSPRRAGDYPFVVIAEDADTGLEESESAGTDTVSGVLRLTHPDSPTLAQLPDVYQEAMIQLSDRDAPVTDALQTFGIGGGDASASALGSALRNRSDWEPYREPPFFTRYLRGFDDIVEPIQESLARIHTLFDPDTTLREFVPWLAQWVALVLDENWPEMKRRRLIREAVELYRWRGTRRGLSRYLEIYASVVPQIYDQPMTGMKIGPETRLGAPETRLGNLPMHTFAVAIAHPNPSELSESTIRAIIEAQKPAHTTYTLTILSMEAV